MSKAKLKKKRRLYAVLIGMGLLGVATALVLTAIEDTLVFFRTPTDIAAETPAPDQRLRLGGLVAKDSVEPQEDGITTRFVIEDGGPHVVAVTYTGVLPDLFREGQGVVTEGVLINGVFRADEVLAKHDENYMPKEVADALKEQGVWQEGEPAPSPNALPSASYGGKATQ
ncbi:MAG: cytochrome c maturation protein CcmE [Alphaproteobacteria bacterium]|nr:cytochrome c maturation protein CcmE [Alphaproteobacteria bacterium]